MQQRERKTSLFLLQDIPVCVVVVVVVVVNFPNLATPQSKACPTSECSLSLKSWLEGGWPVSSEEECCE